LVLSVGATHESVTDFVGGGGGGVFGGDVVGGGVVVGGVFVGLPEPLLVVLLPELLGLPPPHGVVLKLVEVPPLDAAGVEVAALVPLAGLEPLLGQPARSTHAAPTRVSCAKGIRSNCIMVGRGSSGC
jgi:hypothetical protein